MSELQFLPPCRCEGEHTAVLHPSAGFASLHRKADLLAEGVHAIFGIADGVADIQALCFDAAGFSPAQAQTWLRERGFATLEFLEAAKPAGLQPVHTQPLETTMEREFRVEKAGLAGVHWITVCRAAETKARQIFERQVRLYSVGRFRLLDADGNILEERKALPLFSTN